MPEVIDRQAALKKMCELCGYCERFEKAMRSTHPDFVTYKCNAYKFLAEQPTIEPEVRHGRWIFGNSNTSSWMKCSICCKSQSGQTATFSYCPNCGALMDLRTPTEVALDIAGSVMMGGAENG